MRTVLLLCLVLLCAYVCWLLLRWRRLSRAPAASPFSVQGVHRDPDRFSSPADPVAPSGSHSTAPLDDEDDDAHVSLSSSAVQQARPAERAPRPSEPDASGFGFDALLEVRQMRHLVDEQRDRLMVLSEEVYRLREELAAVRAASRVSPAYAEAVSMIRSGMDSQAVAERCGISVAEAELVRALSEQHPEGGVVQ